MSTYRERREARSARLQEWAAKRETRANAEFGNAESISSGIPFGQPILVGHHSERRHRRDLNRIDGSMRRGLESERMAESMSSRAANILAAADHAIYSDDPDAVERLTERIAGLEAERDRMKAANAAYRKEHHAELKAMSAYERGQSVPFPSYALTNLSGNITRNRKRLQALERNAQ